jgi:hypothetical protein
VELAWGDQPGEFSFVIEVKAQSTPLVVRSAIDQVKRFASSQWQPMVMVPYLSPERLLDLEREQVSGVDLCGNGIVIVPGRLLVVRTGNSNLYRESRPLGNPYRGRSAMVARMLLMRPQGLTVTEILASVHRAGGTLSLPQTSKAVQALVDERIAVKIAGVINLVDSARLLDKLGNEWRQPVIRDRRAMRLPSGMDSIALLSSNPELQWAMTGESSVDRHVMFSQGGPRRIAVSNLQLALSLLGGTVEAVPNFADVELLETNEPGCFFANDTDERGIRWASKLQTWLELQSGDARQQDAARDLRAQILREIKA